VITLADFDPQVVTEHHITEQTLDDRHIRRYFRRRIERLAIKLEDGEQIVGEEYAGRFRLRPGLFTVEGETHKEIRQQLWERIFPPPEAESI
jgi:hypothetical protein